jgi:tRNA-dihydrouridine synthase B
MAGVTDRPFRDVCREQGAGLAISEMVTSDQSLWGSRKSRHRLDYRGETGLRIVQIAGSDPQMMAQAAQQNVANGAQIIDINMGCPAKKVCRKAAGSALLRDEKLVSNILQTVTQAVTVPVTLKIRTGWSASTRNALVIAKIAEQAGIQALTIHGRTRECRFGDTVEYDSIAEVKQNIAIPVIANGDIKDPKHAEFVLDYTGADAIMVGRAAFGRPWIFSEINHYLDKGVNLPKPKLGEVERIILDHLDAIHSFYGDFLGVRIARKHVGWYFANFTEGDYSRRHFNQLKTPEEQHLFLLAFFKQFDASLRLVA